MERGHGINIAKYERAQNKKPDKALERAHARKHDPRDS